MLKRFSISLIILATIIYGSLFGMSLHYGTGFFDEFLIQLNRISTNMSQKQEIEHSKLILTTIVENEHPTKIWNNIIFINQQNDQNELFYYYKIWTIKTKISAEDINNSYPIFKSVKDNGILINMRYGKEKPVVQFSFFRNKARDLITGLFFPINEKPFSADYNNDNTVNKVDVALARKAFQSFD